MKTGEHLRTRFGFEFLGRIVYTISLGLLFVILARLLDPRGYGLLFLAISIFIVAQVFSELGLGTSAARYSNLYKETNPTQLPHIIKTSSIYILISITVVSLLLVTYHGRIAELVGEPELALYLFYGVLFVIFASLTNYVRLVLQGLERIELSALVHTVDGFGRLTACSLFVLVGFGAIGALMGYIVGYFLAAVVGIGLVYLHVTNHYRIAETMEPGLANRIFKYNIPLTATNSANVLDKQVDTILIGFFLNPLMVSYYVLSKQIVEFIQTPADTLGFTLSPTYGTYKATNRMEESAKIYERTLLQTLLLYIPGTVGLVLIAEQTIRYVFGANFAGAAPVLQILAAYMLLQAITGITSSSLDYLGRAKERAVAKALTSVANVVLNVLLIPVVGVVGAAVATVITYSCYTGACVYIISTEFSLRCVYLLKKIGIILGIAAVMGIVLVFIGGYVDGPLTLIVVIAICVSIWAFLAMVTGLIDRELFEAVS